MTATTTADPAPQPATNERRGHKVLVTLLLVIGAILTPLAIITLFVKAEVTDTNRYVQTITPVAKDPAVQQYVATELTNQLFEQVDIESYVKEALPSRAEALAGTITSAMKTATQDVVLRAVESDQFQEVWKFANRQAHEQIVAVLTGKHDNSVLHSNNGQVTLDLSSLGKELKTQLDNSGIGVFSKIPVDRLSGQVTLFESKDLYRARRAVGILTALAYILPVLVFASFGGAIYLSKSRRRGFIAAAIAFALGASVIGLGLTVGRSFYLNAVNNADIPTDAAGAIFDALVRFLHTAVRSVIAFSVIVIIAAFFSGPSHLAVWFRGTVHKTVNWLGRESDHAGWGWLGSLAFIRRSKSWLRYVIAAAAFVFLLLWRHPTPSVIFWIALVVLVLLAIIEFYGREPSESGVAAPPAPPAPPTSPAPVT
jgi:hypothetical protein